jgi:hypothetical protein
MSTDTPQPVPSESTTLALGERLLPIVKQIGLWFYAMAIAALYVSGFLVLNSSLAKYGVLDIEFIDARYFLAGAIFVLFLVCFYLFAGRAVLFTPSWLQKDLARTNRDGARPIWSFVVFVHSIVTAVFFCCLSTTMFTSLAIPSANTVAFTAMLAGAFVVLYTIDVTNCDLRFPRASETFSLAVKVAAVYAFFAHGESSTLFSVFALYVSIFFFINLVIDRFTRYKKTNDLVAFTGVYVVVFFVISAAGFGSLVFGHVSSKLGGAKPQTVTISLSEDARKSLPPLISSGTGQLADGKLIHQTPIHMYVESSGQTVRLRTADVVVLVVKPEPESQFFQDYLAKISRPPKAP